MRSSRARVGLAAAAAAVAGAAVAFGLVVANRPPDDWPEREAFCEQAAAMEVGVIGMEEPGAKAEALATLAETAPDELADEFEDILHANEHDDRSMIDQDQVRLVGEFIEENCGVNLPGTTA
ncbi:hypothetical protein [Glycomyces endophyticus]|uniref:hypothetical protein n=1 Tax=Glycomyces endophyticus TaxID=480996 RepID=UPI0031E049F2